jgi:hypothetical protein
MRVPLSIALTLAATCALAQGKIHADPAKPRPGFKPHQLSFETPQDGVARDEFRSHPFYAVILKTAEPCSLKQAELNEIQKQFPANKVFAPMFGCDDEDTITVKQTGKFPGANLRRMQAVLGYP